MWTIVILAGALAAAYAAIRRFRLAQQLRERALSVQDVDSAFQNIPQNFSAAQATELVRVIREGKGLPVKALNPELSKLEIALDSASQWSYGSVDPEQDRVALRQAVVRLYNKWQAVREDL